jgi:hypothetical protein
MKYILGFLIILAATTLVVCAPSSPDVRPLSLVFSGEDPAPHPYAIQETSGIQTKRVFKQLMECRDIPNPPMQCCMFTVIEDDSKPYIEMMCIAAPDNRPSRDASTII